MSNINDVISGVDDVLQSAKQGNFEEAFSKTKSYAEKAGKKSAERLEISRKKIELLDSKTKLAKAYEKFGKLCYDRDNGADIDEDAYQSCVAEIELQRMRSELLDAEIQEMKDKVTDTVSKVYKEVTRSETDAEAAEEAAQPEVEVEVVEPEE
ncbi:MAG: hypothetical protein IJ168_10845 [Eubacterium sp.]|nr:hypothetical protein [Eubacterium sp.]